MNPLISAITIFAAFAAYSVLHSILASPGAKDWAQRSFGAEATRRGYRFFFNVVGVITLLPVLALVAWLPDTPLYSVPFALRPVFLVGQGLGVLLLAAALRMTDALDFAGLRQLAEPQLVTGGVYRYMRHPLYTGSLLVLWLLPGMSVNWFALMLGITLYFIVGAHYEERKLERYFGKAYREYKARTPMFIPRPRKIKEGGS
ncbi:MAG: isoprenylcysteine carboxylmethyltransferase family protein [Anaerolineales bacterium]